MNYEGRKIQKKNGRDRVSSSAERNNQVSGAERRARSAEEITPFDRLKVEIVNFLKNHESSVLVAHTGAGKTTRAPQFLLEALGSGSRIAVTVPRVNIATSVSEFVADMNGYTMGKEVGYQVRFDDTTEKDTNLNFMTDGIMLRKIINDPLLREYDAVMVDEAHERGLNTDLLLGLLKETQKKRKERGMKPLRIVVSSATIEKEKFARYFGTEATMEVEGKMFPVEERYAESNPQNYMKAAAEKCFEIVSSGDAGDILVFMPGRKEIGETMKELHELGVGDQCDIMELHASINKEEQKKVITNRGERRRIIVSTNIAEAGVTVNGIRHVVDSGIIRETEFDPTMRISKLETKEHSQAGLRQRRGRAGRTESGVYHALYTRESFENRLPYSVPEIQRTNLSNLVLSMKKIGIHDVHSFDFIDSPDDGQIDAAVQELKILGALDENEKLTSDGEIMADMPLEPKISRMVVESFKYGCVNDIVTIAAFLGDSRQLFFRPKDLEFEADSAHNRFKNYTSDFLTYLNIWNEYKYLNGGRWRWAKDNFLNPVVLNQIGQAREQILKTLKKNYRENSYTAGFDSEPDDEAIGKSILSGFVSNLAYRERRGRGGGMYKFVHSHGREFSDNDPILVHPSSSCKYAEHDICVTTNIFSTVQPKRANYRIIWISPIQGVPHRWIHEVAPHLLDKEKDSHLSYDSSEDCVYHRTQARLINVPPYVESTTFSLSEKVTSNPDTAAVFAEFLMKTEYFSDITGNNQKVRAEYNDLYIRSGGNIPDQTAISGKFTEKKLQNLYTKLLQDNGNISSIRELREKNINLSFSLDNLITRETKDKILKENPESVTINGKEYPVSYFESGSDCYVRVVLHDEEILQLDDIPTLPSGRKISVVTDRTSYVGLNTDIDELKHGVRMRYNEGAWNEWRRKNYKMFGEKIADIINTDTTLPEPVEYGRDSRTGEPLIAYPGLYQRFDYTVFWEYFREKKEAESSHQHVLGIIEKMKEKKKKEEENEQKREDVIKKLDFYKKELMDMRANPSYDSCAADISDMVKKISNHRLNIFVTSPEPEHSIFKGTEQFLRELADKYENIHEEYEGIMITNELIRDAVHNDLPRTIAGGFQHGHQYCRDTEGRGDGSVRHNGACLI